MGGAVPPLPQYAFMAWCSGEHRDNFTLPLVRITAPSPEADRNATKTNDNENAAS